MAFDSLKKLFRREDVEVRFLAVEKLGLLYSLLTTVFIIIFYDRLDNPQGMLWNRFFILTGLFALIFVYTKFPSRFTVMLRIVVQMSLLTYWYPETFEFCRMFPNLDHLFASAEFCIFGCQPALQFEQVLGSDFWREAFNLGYWLYFPMIALITFYYFFARLSEVERCTFIVLASFFIYYLVFFFVPVAGPQFYFPAIGDSWILSSGSLSSFVVNAGMDRPYLELPADISLADYNLDGKALPACRIADLSNYLIAAFGLQNGDLFTLVRVITEWDSLENEDVYDEPFWQVIQIRVDATNFNPYGGVYGANASVAQITFDDTAHAMYFANAVQPYAEGYAAIWSRQTSTGLKVSTQELVINDVAMSIYYDSFEQPYYNEALGTWGADTGAVLQGAIADGAMETVTVGIKDLKKAFLAEVSTNTQEELTEEEARQVFIGMAQETSSATFRFNSSGKPDGNQIYTPIAVPGNGVDENGENVLLGVTDENGEVVTAPVDLAQLVQSGLDLIRGLFVVRSGTARILFGVVGAVTAGHEAGQQHDCGHHQGDQLFTHGNSSFSFGDLVDFAQQTLQLLRCLYYNYHICIQ